MKPVRVGDLGPRRRQYATGVLCLAAAVVVVLLDDGHRWSWPLFAWGAVAAAVGVIGHHLIIRAGVRAIGLSSEQRATAEARIAADHRAVYPSFLLMAAGFAVAAAGLHNAIFDIVLSGYVVLANFVLPLFLLPQVIRKAADARELVAGRAPDTASRVVAGHSCASATDSCGPAACAICPLAPSAS